jgi:hypothetical protein
VGSNWGRIGAKWKMRSIQAHIGHIKPTWASLERINIEHQEINMPRTLLRRVRGLNKPPGGGKPIPYVYLKPGAIISFFLRFSQQRNEMPHVFKIIRRALRVDRVSFGVLFLRPSLSLSLVLFLSLSLFFSLSRSRCAATPQKPTYKSGPSPRRC